MEISEKALKAVADEINLLTSQRRQLRDLIRDMAAKWGADTVCGWLIGEMTGLAAEVAKESNEL